MFVVFPLVFLWCKLSKGIFCESRFFFFSFMHHVLLWLRTKTYRLRTVLTVSYLIYQRYSHINSKECPGPGPDVSLEQNLRQVAEKQRRNEGRRWKRSGREERNIHKGGSGYHAHMKNATTERFECLSGEQVSIVCLVA